MSVHISGQLQCLARKKVAGISEEGHAEMLPPPKPKCFHLPTVKQNSYSHVCL